MAQIRLVSSHPEVYPPCDDSFLLVDSIISDSSNLLSHSPKFCLEIGCGSGYVLTSLALLLGGEPYYLATDINPHSLNVTRETLRSHQVTHNIDLVRADIVSGLDSRLFGAVDLMVVNPPYVPTPEDEVGSDGIAAAWAGGENGRRVIDRVLNAADLVLSKKGWVYLVLIADNDPAEIRLRMAKIGFRSRIVLQRTTEEEFLLVIKFWRERLEVSQDSFEEEEEEKH